MALARALYAEANICLFDDPLEAVDPVVARHIFQNCFSNEGLLKDKTRLLVTHQIQFFRKFDHCVLLEHGRIRMQGLPSQLLMVEDIPKYVTKDAFVKAVKIVKEEVPLTGTVGCTFG